MEVHYEADEEGEVSSHMQVPNEADQASSSSVGTTPVNSVVQNEDAHVPGNARMMQMVDHELQDLLYDDDAWMMTR